MKKCPNCQKTYEDNLKYCQSDGTPLVVVAEDKPPTDPYKTMVASDLKLSAEEPVSAPEVNVPSEPVKAKSEAFGDDDGVDLGDVLEIPEKPAAVDPMKTMVVSSSDTSDSIKVPDLGETAAADEPDAEVDEAPDDAVEEPELPISEAATIITPEIPKFSEPEIEPPDIGAPDSGSGLFGEKPAAPEKVDSEPSVPIPSPFDLSMPPGYAVPDSPPFEDFAPEPDSKMEGSVAIPPASPFSEEPVGGSGDLSVGPAAGDVPAVISDPGPFGSNEIFSSTEGLAGTGEGDNKTLALVSMILGGVGVLCCVAGILFGPAALITGYMAKGKIAADPSTYGGGTFANIGMGLGVAGIIFSLLAIGLNLFSIIGSF